MVARIAGADGANASQTSRKQEFSMKASAFAFVTLLALAPAVISTASAADLKTGSVLDIARQYADGGKFGGVTSGTTGSTIEVARASMDFLNSSERVASRWTPAPVVAQGD
jgi:hypothetical protein